MGLNRQVLRERAVSSKERWDQQVVPKHQQITTNLHCVTSQKNEGLTLHLLLNDNGQCQFNKHR